MPHHNLLVMGPWYAFLMIPWKRLTSTIRFWAADDKIEKLQKGMVSNIMRHRRMKGTIWRLVVTFIVACSVALKRQSQVNLNMGRWDEECPQSEADIIEAL